MNGAQVHLLLNHFPVIVPIIALPILALGWWRNSLDLQRAGLVSLLFAALIAIPTYLTGDNAETIIKNYPDISRPMIATHQAAAFRSLILLEIAGGLSLLLLILPGCGRPRGWLWATLFGITLASIGLVGWTAHLGGMIRHEEIRPLEFLQQQTPIAITTLSGCGITNDDDNPTSSLIQIHNAYSAWQRRAQRAGALNGISL